MDLIYILQVPVTAQQQVNWASVALALIAIIPSSIAAIIAGMALLQSRRNAEVAAVTDKKVDEVKKDSGVIIEKATEIHTLTNSNLSKVQAQLDVANEKIDGFNKAQGEAARKMANMELLISSLIPPKGTPSPSEVNGAKLDNLQSMLNDVQSGSPPIPVKDEAVLAKLNDVVIGKLDDIQKTVDDPAAPKEKD